MRIVCAIAAGLALAALAAGCGSSSARRRPRRASSRRSIRSPSRPSRSAATASSVTNLTPPGAEPHDIELTPQRRRAAPDGRPRALPLARLPARGREGAAGDGARRRLLDALDGARRCDRSTTTRTSGSTRCCYARIVRADRRGARHAPARAGALARELRALDREYRAGLAALRAARARHEPRGVRLPRAALRPAADRDHRPRRPRPSRARRRSPTLVDARPPRRT